MRFRTAYASAIALSASFTIVSAAVGTPSAVASPSHVHIFGSGSSWAANSVLQWDADVSQSGIQVDFTGAGSAQGRKDFANDQNDFAVSDIGFQGHDPLTGADDTNCGASGKCRPYAYEPLVAGGTAFPYQIKQAGKLVRNLRLSGETLAKIFTYQITNWDDPEITADNNGRKLPSLPIIPVEHSEGSGSTAQFTTYLGAQYPSIWARIGGSSKFTEYYPQPKSGQHGIQQNGSDGVINFVTSAAANGAIGYDEYSYALGKNWPVAKLENAAGYFTLPTQYNVAVALTHAKINMDKSSPNYLLQDLHQVYVAPEKQVYAMSSYSYFVIPTGTTAQDSRMSTAKRQTLADYLGYSLCEGQKEMGPIGYSPLPINLVEASFEQTAKLKQADPAVDISQHNVNTCGNPTFSDSGHPELNRLAQIAPVPPICDKVGQGPANADGTCPGSGGGAGSGGGSGGSGSSGSGGTNGAGPGKATINPDTGQLQFGDSGNSGGGAGGAAQPNAANVSDNRPGGLAGTLSALAVLELIAVLVVPPILWHYVLRRRRTGSP